MSKLTAQEIADGIESEQYFHAGCFAYGAKDVEEARRCFEESLRLCPDNQNSRDALEKIKKESA